MKRSAIVDAQFQPAAIQIDVEFEELEQRTAPQSDTSYLDFTSGARGR
jgi:hypothetical protein